METPRQETARLLAALAAGDSSAFDEVFERVYDELKAKAVGRMRREPPGLTVQASGLVNEVYLELKRQKNRNFNDRKHFLAVASLAMRRLLVDRARRRLRAPQKEPLSESITAGVGAMPQVDILDLDKALAELASLGKRRARQAKLVELMWFCGLTGDEAAEVLGVSPRTVDDDWKLARAWLRRRLAR